MKKTNLFASLVAGSALAFAAFGCSHTNPDTTAPNQYTGVGAPGSVNPDLNQGGMEPGVGSGVNQRQNVNGTDGTITTPNGPIQQNNNLPTSPNTNPGMHPTTGTGTGTGTGTHGGMSPGGK